MTDPVDNALDHGRPGETASAAWTARRNHPECCGCLAQWTPHRIPSDGRLAALHIQAPGDWIELHSAIGEITTPIALLFGLYAITVGRWKLRKPGNAAALLAFALSIGSGQFMDEDWLLDRQFTTRSTACI